MRNSISHHKNDLEGTRSHNPTKLLCLSPEIQCTREITPLTGSSSHDELNPPGTFYRNPTTETPTVSALAYSCISSAVPLPRPPSFPWLLLLSSSAVRRCHLFSASPLCHLLVERSAASTIPWCQFPLPRPFHSSRL